MLAIVDLDVEWLDLQGRSIKGNSHALMTDDDGGAIADAVLNDEMKRCPLVG